jgi:hypothetical protein
MNIDDTWCVWPVIPLQMKRTFTPREVEQYGTLIGDLNPIHLVGDTVQDGTESDFNEEYHTSKIIVHGMLTASLFSSIFGTLIPGELQFLGIYLYSSSSNGRRYISSLFWISCNTSTTMIHSNLYFGKDPYIGRNPCNFEILYIAIKKLLVGCVSQTYGICVEGYWWLVIQKYWVPSMMGRRIQL